MKRLDELFDVVYGSKLDLNKMTLSPTGVNFVGRSSQNHGVSAIVARVPNVDPFEAGMITVALGGSRLLTSFVQDRPFYTAQNVAVLRPLVEFTFAQKLYLCLCIAHNRFRYSAFGREANRTLKQLLVPEPSEFPGWLSNVPQSVDAVEIPPAIKEPTPEIDPPEWRPFKLSDLFEFKRGQGVTKSTRESGSTPYIGALDRNNGLVEYVAQPPMHPAGTLTLNWNGVGGAGVAFYQPSAYWCSGDVVALYPRFEMTAAMALFVTTLIRKERYRFGFGRKLTLGRMAETEIRLPVVADGKPNWEFMDRFMKTLPFSSQL